VVQPFVANEGDAWVHTLDELGRFAERVVAEHLDERPTPRLSRTPLEHALRGIPEEVHEQVGPFLSLAKLLGQRTAQMHIALAADVDDPALAPEPLTSLSQRSLYQSLRNGVRIGLRGARRSAGNLDADLQAQLTAVVDREDEILERLKGCPRSGWSCPGSAPTATTTSARCCSPDVTS
jgi:maltose alpha-D-glucosyltransferase / alpha-amylase